jgi:fibronectin type 3 domain-containing protein
MKSCFMLNQIAILFFICISFTDVYAQKQKGTLPIREGEEGVYLFLSPQRFTPDNGALKYSEVVISRSIGTEEKYVELGRLQAATSITAFKKIVGSDGLIPIMKFKNLKTEEEAWQYILRNPRIENYGLLSSDIRFLEAMGICFADKEVQRLPIGTVLKYKVRFRSSVNAEQTSTVEGSIVLMKKAVIEKPVLQSVKEKDSTIIIRWAASETGSSDAMFAKVFRKKGNLGTYSEAGYTIANKDTANRTVFYEWRDQVVPKTQYHYYLIPQTMTGLQGTVSDTAAAISADFRTLLQSSVLTASDTLQGILLKWERLAQPELVAGIILERSKENAQTFQVIDTLSTDASEYLDAHALPDLYYTYRIRLLSIRKTLLDVSAQVTAMHRLPVAFIEPPVGLKAVSNEKSIRLSWQKVQQQGVSGYYIYRSSSSDQEWELVSNLLQDTTFTDTTIHSSRIQFKYVVVAVNFSDAKSKFSTPAYGRITKQELPDAPPGLLVYDDIGRMVITWSDVRINDELVAGYHLYRKQATAGSLPFEGNLSTAELKRKGFQRVNKSLLLETIFTDPVQTAYEYAVTAVDLHGQESEAWNTVVAKLVDIGFRPPSGIAARRTSKGIELTWNANLQPGVEKYIVLRRLPEEKTLVQIGSVDVSKTSFTDTKLVPGKLYFYSVQCIGKNRKSEPGDEKGVRY